MAERPRKYGNNVEPIIDTLIIDGNALFKLGFYGAKDQFNRNGDHIGGLYQFITIVRKLLMEKVYHKVFVFWDGQFSGKMRYLIYKDYKSARGKDYEHGTHPIDPQEKKEKFLISQYLEELCIRQHIDDSQTGVEADDFIAYYCMTKDANERLTICTSDRDLCQLIGDGIRIYLCDLKEYVTKGNYQTFFKHHQTNSKLIKIIGGDDSDSIKGIKGVKEPTLLKYFPELTERKVELDEILKSAVEQQNERAKNKMKPLQALTNIADSITEGIQGKDIYKINKVLVDLSVPLVDNINKYAVQELKGPITDIDNRGIKNVFTYMKRDGVDELIYNFSTEYLLPFKELIEREKKKILTQI